MSKFIEDQHWRYATKKFDATKKISDNDFEILKEAIRLSASSYGLQPYKVFIIEDNIIREKLMEFSWKQAQVVDASHLIVIANYTQISAEIIDNYIDRIANARNIPAENIKGYGDFMKTKILGLTPEETAVWTSKQTYLAMGNLLNAAAELKIDATPMEGFEIEKYNELLNLTSQGLSASLVIPVGYRHDDDATQHLNKVRKSKEELFLTI